MSLFDQPVGYSPLVPTTAPNTAAPKSHKARPPQKPKKPMAEWLLRKLELDGIIDNSKAGPSATRKCIAISCPHCRRPIMRGLMGLPCAWPVDVEPTPLSGAGEALALLTGIKTYELRWMYDHYEVDYREVSKLHHRPASANQGFDILVEHRCGLPQTWPTMLSQLPHPHAESEALPDEPPF